MRRNWKKVLSLWLAVAMVFTMNFGSATAVYAADIAGTIKDSDGSSDAKTNLTVTQVGTKKAANLYKVVVAGKNEGDDFDVEWSVDGEADSNDRIKTVADHTIAAHLIDKDTGDDVTFTDPSPITLTVIETPTYTVGLAGNGTEKKFNSEDKLNTIYALSVKDSSETDKSGEVTPTYSILYDGSEVSGYGAGNSVDLSSVDAKALYTANAKKTGEYTIKADVALTSNDGHAQLSETSVTATLTITGPENTATGTWELKKGDNVVTEEDATYNPESKTITIKTAGDDYSLSPADQNAPELNIEATVADVKITLDGIATPKSITNTGAKSITIISGNSAKNIVINNNGDTIVPAGATGLPLVTGESVTVATYKDVNVNSSLVAVDVDKFGVFDHDKVYAYSGLNSDRDKLSGATETKVFAKNNEELISFMVSANKAGNMSTINGDDTHGKLVASDITTTTATLTVGKTGGLKSNEYGYTAILVSSDGLVKKTDISAKDTEDTVIKFENLIPGATYYEFYISANSALKGNTVILGSKSGEMFANATAQSSITTYLTAPKEGDVTVTAEPKKITVSSNVNGEKLLVYVLSGNEAEVDWIKAKIKETSDLVKIETGATDFAGEKNHNTEYGKAIVSVNGNPSPTFDTLIIEPGKTYYVYGAYVTGTGTYTLASDLIKLGQVTTAAQTPITTSFTQENFSFAYLGPNQSIEKMVSTTSSPSAAKGRIEVRAIPLDNYKADDVTYGGVDNVFNHYASDDTTLVTAKKNWLSGNYVAMAKFIHADGDTTYISANTVSTNFQITRQKVYAVPTLKKFSVSVNQKLGANYDDGVTADKFKYVIVSRNDIAINGKNDDGVENKPLEGFTLTQYKYVAEGKVLSATSSFDKAGEKKVTISLNGGTLKIAGRSDADSYEVVTGVSIANESKEERMDSFFVLDAGEIYLSTSSKPLYYQKYYEMANDEAKQQKDIREYIVATMKNVDITDITEIKYIYRDKNNKLIADGKMPKTLSANDWLYVSVNCAPNGRNGSGEPIGDAYYSVTPLGIRIVKQPVRVIGTADDIASARWSDSLTTAYGKTKSIKIYPYEYKDGKDVLVDIKDENKIRPDYGTWGSIVDKDAVIDVTGVDAERAEIYGNLPMTWDSASVNTAFGSCYEIRDAYLKKYSVSPAFRIKIMSSETGSALYEPEKVAFLSWNGISNIVNYNNAGTSKTSFTISANSGRKPARWGIVVAKGSSTDLIESADETGDVNYNATVEGTPVNVAGAVHVTGTFPYYTFDISKYAANETLKTKDLVIYGIFEPEVTKNTSGTITYTSIRPVFYDGLSHVSDEEDAKKGRNNDLSLKISNVAGGDLNKDVDYTLSYKNNKNVGYADDPKKNKRPMVIVKGKGEYKNLNLEIPFTILPQSFENATISVKTPYVANKKNGKINIGETVKLGTAKINKSYYDLSFWTEDNRKMTEAEIARYYEGTTVLKLKVRATSKNPKNNAVNFSVGETAVYSDVIYVYPKGGKKFSVKYNDNAKYTYSSTLKTVTTGKITDKNNVKEFKVGKEDLRSTYSKFVADYEFYKDKNLTDKITDPDEDTLNSVGTYYMAIIPNDEANKKYNVFQPTVVTVKFSGKKINSFVGINKNYKKLVPYSDEQQKVVLDLKDTKNGTCTINDFDIIVTDVQGKEYIADKAIYSKDTKQDKTKVQFHYNNAKDSNNNPIPGVDNQKGSYKFTVRGKGEYEGKLNLSYSYGKSSQSNLKKEIVVKIDAQEFNAAGYDEGIINIFSADGKTNLNTKKGEYQPYEISNVKWVVNQLGEKKGKAQITFKNYSGTYTQSFDVKAVPISKVEIIAPSVSSKNTNKSKVYLQQTSTDKKRTAKLTAGKDYVLGTPTVAGKTASVKISIPEKGSRLSGSAMNAQYTIYDTEVKNLKIAELSTNEVYAKTEAQYAGSKFQHTTGTYAAARDGVAPTFSEVSGNIIYDATGKYYLYKGTAYTNVVMPKVVKVTCTYGTEKDHVIEPDCYNVDYTIVTNKYDDPTISSKYKVTITINEKGAAKYPSFESASMTYAVNQNSK